MKFETVELQDLATAKCVVPATLHYHKDLEVHLRLIDGVEESPSGADSSVLVEQLRAKNPFKLNTQGSRDRGEGYEEACLMLYSLAQYNAVEPEKKQEIKKLDGLHELLIGHLDKMNIASQELFDEKKANPNNKKGSLQAAWNKLSGVLFSAKVTVQTIRDMQPPSLPGETPIDREPDQDEAWLNVVMIVDRGRSRNEKYEQIVENLKSKFNAIPKQNRAGFQWVINNATSSDKEPEGDQEVMWRFCIDNILGRNVSSQQDFDKALSHFMNKYRIEKKDNVPQTPRIPISQPGELDTVGEHPSDREPEETEIEKLKDSLGAAKMALEAIMKGDAIFPRTLAQQTLIIINGE